MSAVTAAAADFAIMLNLRREALGAKSPVWIAPPVPVATPKPKKLSYHDVTPEKEREMVQRFQAGDRQAGDFLLRACDGHLRRDFSGYMKKLGDDEVMQAAGVGILTALRRFDVGREVRLYTFARYHVLKELAALAAQSSMEDSLDEPMGEDDSRTLLDTLAYSCQSPEDAVILAEEIRRGRQIGGQRDVPREGGLTC